MLLAVAKELTMFERHAFLASLSIALIGAGCGTTVITGNTGGAGGETGGTSVTTGTTVTSTTSTGTTTSTTTTTGVGGSGGGVQPPDPGPVSPPDGTGSSVFAVRRLFLGDTDPDGTPNPNAWKQYGYDLDGHISTATSTGLCKPRDNAPPKNVYPDGANGIDNAFGKNIMPIFLGIASDFSTNVNAAIAQGEGTVLLDLENLGAGSSYNPLLSRYYEGGKLGGAPTWSGGDLWPVTFESLSSPPDLASAKAQAPQSYVVGNTWVAPIKGDIAVRLDFGQFALKLPIHNPIITMELDAAHQSAKNGVIAGVIPTDPFLAMIKQVAGTFDPVLCGGPTIDSVLSQMAQASDILLDGTQDPSKTCDGISIGLGFEAHAVKFGPVAPPAPPPPNPCLP